MLSHIVLGIAAVATIPTARAVVIGIVTVAVAWESVELIRLNIFVLTKGIVCRFYECTRFVKLYTFSNHRAKTHRRGELQNTYTCAVGAPLNTKWAPQRPLHLTAGSRQPHFLQ